MTAILILLVFIGLAIVGLTSIMAFLIVCWLSGKGSNSTTPPNKDIWGAQGELPPRSPNKNIWG